MKHIPFIVMLLVFLTACGIGPAIPATEMVTSTLIPVATASATSTLRPGEMPAPSPAPKATLAPDAWKSMPVVPVGVSQRMVEIFQNGLVRDRDPSRFSKIGDCQNITPYFLAAFSDPSKYRLGDQYAYLQPTIDHFSGSWSRKSVATHSGFNAATVLNPFWMLVPKPDECEQDETPASCELRINNPSYVVISMEEEWSGDLVKYDHYMRMLVEYVLSQDMVPIIATRAELPDAQISINAIVVQIAYDYGIPLWNFGAATASLPNYGLSADGFHLTPGTVEGNYYFDDPASMELGWTLRNLTALQAIGAVYRALSSQP
jgi:hypothetical protein